MTNKLNTYNESKADSTVISNLFIDEFMPSANDAQIKIYLYLLRMIHAHKAFTLCDMADKFNHTEKDVLRSLCYWEKCKLLSLDYDKEQCINGIHLLPLPVAPTSAQIVPMSTKFVPVNPPKVSEEAPINKNEKPSYSADTLKAFRKNEENAQIIFITEQYLEKTLTKSDLDALYYISNDLNFSNDLIDYLIQYCVGKGKRQFSYITKVALDWKENNISDIKQAKSRSNKYDKQIYTIMKALGNPNEPTELEVSFIKQWVSEYGCTLDIILYACEKTVLSTVNNRFQYANAILSNWTKQNLHSLKDIKDYEATHKTSKKASKKEIGFNDFNQRNYDFDELEKMLFIN